MSLRILGIIGCVALLLTAGASVAGAQTAGAPSYRITFEARIVPSQRVAEARWRLSDRSGAMRSLTLLIDPERHVDFRGDGSVEVSEDGRELEWVPPAQGGTLSYRFVIDQVRGAGNGYEARCSDTWAVFRGDDLFPAARTRTLKGARSETRLRLLVPEGWSVATPYERIDATRFRVEDPSRRFDRPTGWMTVGELGVLRERVAGSRIAVAGPVGHGVRRLDILAMLRWNLPEFRDLLGALPERLLIVSAGDPMWRGGLSGAHSAYVHADRPLIAADTTSPILHEIFHSMTRARAGSDGDWVVEGLAEYYALEALVRSRTISKRRFRRAIERMERRAAGAQLQGRESKGAATARAVIVLRELDALIRQRSGDQKSLDDVVPELAQRREPITTEGFRKIAEAQTGIDLGDFFRRRVAREVAASLR